MSQQKATPPVPMTDARGNSIYISEEDAAKNCAAGFHDWSEMGEGPGAFCLHCGATIAKPGAKVKQPKRQLFPATNGIDLMIATVESAQREAIFNGMVDKPSRDVLENADANRHKKPNIRTLSEEYAEAILASRGKHEHPLRLELVQIAGVCINMIRQIDAGEEFKP